MILAEANHPTRDELMDFSIGKLAEASSKKIELHLDQCSDCNAILDQEQVSDPLVEMVQKLPGFEMTSSEEEQQTVAPSGVTVPAFHAVEDLDQATNRDEFFHSLQESLLLDAVRIEEIKQSSKTVQEAIEQLLEADRLTEFQIDCIVAGNTQRLVFESYVIRNYLGGGGMGHVFLAEHCEMKRLVALKTMLIENVDDEIRRRFQREIEAIAQLSHPNIVSAYDARLSGPFQFLVMEFVPGIDLYHKVRSDGPLTVSNAINLVKQAALGLKFAHENGIVHRDIKPGNLIVTGDNQLKILDMGLAGLATPISDPRPLTPPGRIMGTVDFMPPEQMDGSTNPDARMDIYALGCTLYWLLTGKAVFRGQTDIQKMLAHRESEIPLIGDFRNDVPESVEFIFQKMVAKSPDERFQTCDELIKALDGIENATNEIQTSSAKELVKNKAGSRSKFGWMIAAIFAVIFFSWLYYEIVVRVDLKSGTVVIESNQPAFNVWVDDEKQEVKLIDPSNKKEFKVSIPNGAKTLRVASEGYKSDVEEFQLNPGENRIVVRFEPRESTDIVDEDRLLKVANWVYTNGGQIIVKKERVYTLGDSSASIYLNGSETLRDADLAKLKGIPFSTLMLTGTSIDGSGFKALSGMKFDSLNLTNTKVEDSTFEPIKNLEINIYLLLSKNDISDKGLKGLRMPRALYLDECPITDDWHEGMKGHQRAQRVSLVGTDVTDSTLEFLATLKYLTQVNVKGTKVTQEGVEKFKEQCPDCEIKSDFDQ